MFKSTVFTVLLSFLILSILSTCSVIVPFDQWEHQRVQLKDVNIYFRYAGSGSPILLVHGVPQYSVNRHHHKRVNSS